MAAVQIVALADVVGETAQLARGAAAFALQAGGGQAGFLRADFGDGVGAGLDLIGDGVEEVGAFGARGISVGPEGVLGSKGCGMAQFGRADAEAVRGAMRRGAGET